MLYAFIADRCADLPVEQCCRAMKVSRPAFFAWRRRQSSPTLNVELGELIVKIDEQVGSTSPWL
jgi:hypothetical protein